MSKKPPEAFQLPEGMASPDRAQRLADYTQNKRQLDEQKRMIDDLAKLLDVNMKLGDGEVVTMGNVYELYRQEPTHKTLRERGGITVPQEIFNKIRELLSERAGKQLTPEMVSDEIAKIITVKALPPEMMIDSTNAPHGRSGLNTRPARQFKAVIIDNLKIQS